MNKQQAFIMKISRGAVEGMRKYGILPSVTMAQAILESGWGKSGLTKASNNLFGIKAGGSWGGDVVSYPTKEYVDGKYVDVTADFRAYDSLDASMEDHGAFLAGLDRYKNIIGVKDFRKVCRLLQEDGYATAPNYANSLIALIEQYDLAAYDNGLFCFQACVSGGDFDRLHALGEELGLKMTWEAYNNECE